MIKTNGESGELILLKSAKQSLILLNSLIQSISTLTQKNIWTTFRQEQTMKFNKESINKSPLLCKIQTFCQRHFNKWNLKLNVLFAKSNLAKDKSISAIPVTKFNAKIASNFILQIIRLSLFWDHNTQPCRLENPWSSKNRNLTKKKKLN